MFYQVQFTLQDTVHEDDETHQVQIEMESEENGKVVFQLWPWHLTFHHMYLENDKVVFSLWPWQLTFHHMRPWQLTFHHMRPWQMTLHQMWS